MVFQGSKAKHAKQIAPIINKYIKDHNITQFYDIFCGGANLCDKIECDTVVANDLSPTLISLHQQAQKDFSLIPERGGRQFWDKAREEYHKILNNFSLDKTLEDYQALISMPLYCCAAAEFYESFSRAGFYKGYAKPTETRNYYQEARHNHYKQAQTNSYQKIKFVCGNYLDLDIPEGALIYCDPPYKDTQQYEINKKLNFNYEEFYNFLRQKSKTNPIFISEQEMPEEFELVWKKDVNRTLELNNKCKAVERLYFIGP